MPKLYICVRPNHYFDVIRMLIEKTEPLKLRWKFCRDVSQLSRPDKIVLYFESTAHLKRVLPHLREGLAGMTFHRLSNAGLTTELGLEKSGTGIYVGTDPLFLDLSWRQYRSIVAMSLRKNKGYWTEQPGGLPQALRLFNVSADHEGPRLLQPGKRQTQKLRQLWASII